jgi:type IV secretory pathway TrbD component
MSDSDEVAGWTAPIYQSLAQPLLFAHVPHGFLVTLLTSTCIVFLRWWPVVVVSGLLYGGVRLGTAYEPQFLLMLWRHISYSAFYEG